jgi:2-polyprenyl-3-methyl-5-hydroxy-6-metoxy-1,4-benzoquinol methylase
MCDTCGLVYTDPKMSEQELSTFYEKEYRELYGNSNEQQRQAHMASEARHAQTAMNILVRHMDVEAIKSQEYGQMQFLDIGASMGRVTSCVKELFGDAAKVIGVEPCIEYGELGLKFNQEKNLPEYVLKYSAFENFNTDDRFDFVTILNTLEHFHSPKKVLKKLHGMMDDKAIVLVAVPNILHIDPLMPCDVFLSSAHLFHFAPPTLSLLLISCGFKPIEVLGIVEEVGEKIYLVAERSTEVPELTFDKKPNFGLMRQYLLEHDAAVASRVTLGQGGYYK